MIRPLSLFIGLRYTRAKRRNNFISFIALASMLGIALGVTVLITVLSVMNGFDEQIRKRFFALAPEITVMSSRDITHTWPQLQKDVQKVPGIIAAAPYIEGKGMLQQGSDMQAVNVLGIDPEQEKKISQLAKRIKKGDLDSLKTDTFNIVLGQEMANHLGLRLGDKITLLTPQMTTTPFGIIPRFKQFTVSGIFHASSGFGFEMGVAYINLQDANRLFTGTQMTSGLHITLKNIYQAELKSLQVRNVLPLDFLVTNWVRQSGAFFHALVMEKTILFVILLLIIAVAVFNLISTLVMVVNEKRSDIAILRTLGATPRTIMFTFIVQGAVIGIVGTFLGLIGGILLSYNITSLVNLLQRLFDIQILSSAVYFVNYLPSKIMMSDILQVCGIALLLSLLATLYPAWIAFKTEPAEALRYE